ncbi:hypothetical protein J2X54_003688 [Duganella sp. 3397]|uniref:hypothetical protein n=1 Tax=Duganella sp. 3397 TaxID=2817732 RepID=UPI00285D3921|nr:hypothetical protein [Duganella sp. 3397]MDR7051201.1 hypothetical protein [Duganella sp. 3397]
MSIENRPSVERALAHPSCDPTDAWGICFRSAYWCAATGNEGKATVAGCMKKKRRPRPDAILVPKNLIRFPTTLFAFPPLLRGLDDGVALYAILRQRLMRTRQQQQQRQTP